MARANFCSSVSARGMRMDGRPKPTQCDQVLSDFTAQVGSTNFDDAEASWSVPDAASDRPDLEFAVTCFYWKAETGGQWTVTSKVPYEKSLGIQMVTETTWSGSKNDLSKLDVYAWNSRHDASLCSFFDDSFAKCVDNKYLQTILAWLTEMIQDDEASAFLSAESTRPIFLKATRPLEDYQQGQHFVA